MHATKVQPPSAEVCHPSILQTRGCHLCDPSHSGMGGMHLCHLNALTETSRGGSSPMSPSVRKHYPRALQGLHRCLLRRGLHQTPQREDVPPLQLELLCSSSRRRKAPSTKCRTTRS